MDIAESPFRFHSKNGTTFFAKRGDFTGGVWYRTPAGLLQNRMYQDVAEMIGHHATSVLPQLNGFAGYDAIGFESRARLGVGV